LQRAAYACGKGCAFDASGHSHCILNMWRSKCKDRGRLHGGFRGTRASVSLTHFQRESNKFAIAPDSLYSARTSKQLRLRKFELHLSLTPSFSAPFSEQLLPPRLATIPVRWRRLPPVACSRSPAR
jgi:hypothetical protein